MKKKVVKIFALMLSFLVFGVFCIYWSFLSKKDTLTSCANSSLYTLNDVIDTLEHLESFNFNDPIMKEKLEIMLVKQLVLVRSIKPNISKLQGTPLKALCRTIAYKRRNGIGMSGLGKYKDKKLANLATEYLDSIEGDLIEHIEQMDGFFSKSDCPILQ